MRLVSSVLILCTNLLTATLVTICHYAMNIPLQSTMKLPRMPPSFHQRPHQNFNHDILSYFNSLSPSMASLVDTQSAIKVLHTNCSLPQKASANCSFVQFEALLNLADRTVCRCEDSRVSVGNRCHLNTRTKSAELAPSVTSGVSVFAVTPTYTRHTQKLDLTSLCYTIEQVPDLIWIVVEDSSSKTKLVSDLLSRCKVRSIHLNAKTSSVYKVLHSRGVEQRNAALTWIREHCKPTHTRPECQRGVLYFMDDDNKYDRRLFEEIKKTRVVSVLPVAFSGGLKFEGPICKNGSAVKWRAHYAPERTFPMDMAGFAINIRAFLAKAGVKMGFKDIKGHKLPVKDGHLETDYLENFASRQTVECRGSDKEVFVWHVKTLKPPLPYEAKHASTSKLEV